MTSVASRALFPERMGGVTLLDALWTDGLARVTLSAPGLSTDAFSVASGEVVSRQALLSAVTLEIISSRPEIEITCPEGHFRVLARPPETDLFAGLNAALAFRTFDRPETTLDWLTWHRDHHGLEAALIVDRAKSQGFEDALRATVEPGLGVKIVVLRPGVPLGKPGLGSEAETYYAPDAPGRDRMEPPQEDRWHAPLGEIAIFEILRHRYLATAAAVMNVDLSDLVAPIDGAGVFGRARASASGVVPLAGRHVYPWRIPPDRDAGFGDHICRMFDSHAIRWRWCAAPEKLQDAAQWRLLRIAGARAERSAAHRFWRCMAVRHPGQKTAALVPKSSLIEDPEQRRALGARFGSGAERIPEISLRQPPQPGTITFVTTVKNEGPFILDWLAWHRAMGADRFLVYSNDCTDGTEELLVALDRAGVITHRNNDGYRATQRTPQHSVLMAADEDVVVQQADWTLFVDVDEYVNVKVGAGRFEDLFLALPGANMISMTWRLFGNADVHAFEDRPVFEQFGLCAPELCRKPHQAWGFKTLFRNLGIYRKLGVHRPKGLNPQLANHIRWMNGSGRPMPVGLYRNGWRSTQTTYGYDVVQLNHYAVRSAESFLVKRERGRANHVTRDQGLNYWFRMNHNSEEGGVNAKMLPLFAAEKERLLALPGIAAAHAEAVRRHRLRIAELREDPVYADFFATLTGRRMERLSRLLGHFGAGVFHIGPHAVPDNKVFGDWAPGEFFTVPLPTAAE